MVKSVPKQTTQAAKHENMLSLAGNMDDGAAVDMFKLK